MSEELRPCPFCGTAPEESYRDVDITWADPGTIARYHKIQCPNCGTWMEDSRKTYLRERWNGLTRLDRCPVCANYVRRMEPNDTNMGVDRYYVRCDHCGLTTRKFDNPMEARIFWNTRSNHE